MGISQEINSSNDAHCKIEGLTSKAKVSTFTKHCEGWGVMYGTRYKELMGWMYIILLSILRQRQNKKESVELVLGC
jgi:hypothetical protein